MSIQRSDTFAWCCAITIFLSAVLLFLVQPIISKIILPWYGGSPAVWTTCMLFFQTLLLAGYGYAHYLARRFTLPWQIRIHGVVTLAAAITLPIAPAQVPDSVDQPVASMLKLLALNVGLPFFALSATGPLLQNWFGHLYPGRPPYRLYALSNIGSLGALWLFPFALEPWLTSGRQDLMWSSAFGIYLVSIFAMLILVERMPVDADELIYPQRARGRQPVPWKELVAWLALPALASVLLVSVTSYLCQDMPSIPFMWILPLSLYLLTFILAFDSPRWYIRPLWGVLAVLSLSAVAVLMLDISVNSTLHAWRLLPADFDLTEYSDRPDVQTFVFLSALFTVAMICHGETTRRKPDTGNLTLFYLAIAAGGALGSGLVAIVCPLVFKGFYELNISLVLGYLLAGGILASVASNTFDRASWRLTLSASVGLALAAGLALLINAQLNNVRSKADFQTRNFYGIASVRTEKDEEGQPVGRVLYNGQINHGYQFLDPPWRYEPNSYYDRGSGVEIAFRILRDDKQPLRVGVIGLGTGTLAAFGRDGDRFQFYEIDKKIHEIARTHFTYLEDSQADVRVRMGDARITLQEQLRSEGSQQLDLLVVDAFSGDAIPIHLLTLEAFDLYYQHLSPRGVLAVHVSNRHLDLDRIVARLGRETGYRAFLVSYYNDGTGSYDASSDWVLVTRNPEVAHHPVLVSNAVRIDNRRGEYADAPLWTDSFSNIWQVMDDWTLSDLLSVFRRARSE